MGEFLVPLADCMVPGAAAVGAFRPDALVVDQQALAEVAVALARDLPWATSATTSAMLTDPMELIPHEVKEWADGRPAAEVLVRAGVDPRTAASVDLRFSPGVVLVFSTTIVGRDDFRCTTPS